MSFLDRWRAAYAEVSAIAKLARLLVALEALEGQWRQTAARWEQASRDGTDLQLQAHFAALAGDRTTCAEQLAKVRAG